MSRWKPKVSTELLQTCRRCPSFPPSKMKGVGEKALDITPALLILAYFESLFEIVTDLVNNSITQYRASDYNKTNLNDAELSSRKGLLIYHCACIACVHVHANTHTHTHSHSMSLAFDLQAGEVSAKACYVTAVSCLGGKLQALFPELALFASASASHSQRPALCMVQSCCHHEPS